MRVFVAGGSGALGRPLIRQLVAKGHDVVGLTRYRPDEIEDLGAKPAVADAFDAENIQRAVAEAEPEAVIHALTRIPKTPYPTPGRLKTNDRLRIEGTRNLLGAARAAGVKKVVGESITFAFQGRSEDKMKPLETMGAFQRSIEAAQSLERQILEYPGVVLRYAYFYGPGTTFTEEIPRALKRRLMAIIGKGSSWWSFIHVEDAASATIAAMEVGRDGEVYNICDDEPILAANALDLIAEAASAPKPLRLPAIAPFYVRHYFNSQTGANNAKAKAELGWQPLYPSLREGYTAT